MAVLLAGSSAGSRDEWWADLKVGAKVAWTVDGKVVWTAAWKVAWMDDDSVGQLVSGLVVSTVACLAVLRAASGAG